MRLVPEKTHVWYRTVVAPIIVSLVYHKTVSSILGRDRNGSGYSYLRSFPIDDASIICMLGDVL
jgi:hypothetical protein